MSGFSINTNSAAQIALQNLSATQSKLAQTQNIMSTGLKVASAQDNGATYAIATRERSDVASLGTLQTSIENAKSVTDVAMSAGDSLQSLLSEMKEKALAATDTSLDTTSRNALSGDLQQLVQQYNQTQSSAEFNGINLLESQSLKVPASLNGGTITVAPVDMALGGFGGLFSGSSSQLASISTTMSVSLSTTTLASEWTEALDMAIDQAGVRLAALGTQSSQLDRQATLLGKLSDTMTSGIGNLVDADMANESATLQSLQTKEQLGVQALSIANQAPSVVLSLFR